MFPKHLPQHVFDAITLIGRHDYAVNSPLYVWRQLAQEECDCPHRQLHLHMIHLMINNKDQLWVRS